MPAPTQQLPIMTDLSIVVPLLNEAESLPELAAWIHRVCRQQGYQFEILFVDDGSTDGSWAVITTLAQQYPNTVKGIRFRRNYGKSAALNEGFRAAQGKVVITMDADLQDSPDEIPELYDLIARQNYDLVSGWKQKRYDNTLTKNLPSKLFNAATRAMSGIPLHDFNCGLKSYKIDVVKAIEVYGEMHRYIPILAKWEGYSRITEKVVTHQARKYGTSKFGIERFINGFLDLLTIFFMGKFGKRPMHFFGLIGTVIFVIGFCFATYLSIMKLIYEQYGMTDRPLFYLAMLCMIVGSQTFLAGFLGELIARNSPYKNDYHVTEQIGITPSVSTNS